MFLSRLTLSRAPSAAALDALLNPLGAARLDAHHRLLWSLFSDGPDRLRDFLWREEGRGMFLTPSARPPLAQREGADWLAGQGVRAGFRLIGAKVSDYATVALSGFRGRRKGQLQFGILEMTGLLEVTDPAALLARLAQGFGRAKAFGCGLMLVRRG